MSLIVAIGLLLGIFSAVAGVIMVSARVKIVEKKIELIAQQVGLGFTHTGGDVILSKKLVDK